MALSRLAFVDGNVLTQNPEQPEAEAVLAVGGRIDRVGSTAAVREHADADTEVIDLDGRTLLPGFIDAHQHPLGYGLAKSGGWVDCSGIESIDDLVALGEAAAAETPAGEWIIGRGWPIAQLERMPHKSDFAGRVEEHPLWFNDLSGHLWIVNERGLEAIGVDADTPAPEIGKIDRGAGGEPTGIFRDNAPFGYLEDPEPFSQADIEAGLRETQRRANAFGITTLGQIGIWVPPGGYGRERVAPWLRFREADELTVRVRLMLEPYRMIWETGDFTHLEALADLGVRTGFGDDMVKLGPLKIICDGWQDAKSGQMFEPYANDESRTGYLYRSDPEDYRRMVEMATRAGLQVGIHADGDRSAELTIQAYEDVAERYPERFDELRHRFEHARVLTEDQIDRIAELDLHVCAAPVSYSREPWYVEMLEANVGPERRDRLLRHKTLWDRGVTVSGGSDLHPGRDEWMEPLYAIQQLVTEGPEDERFSVEEALRMYTRNGGHSYREEDTLGVLQPGAHADFVVLDRDPRAVDPGRIADIGVERTVVGGETVYGG